MFCQFLNYGVSSYIYSLISKLEHTLINTLINVYIEFEKNQIIKNIAIHFFRSVLLKTLTKSWLVD